MSTHQVFIGVGSNIDPETNIAEAAAMLLEHSDVLNCSKFYRSAAIDRPELPDFINGAFEITTGLGPQSLKTTILQPIEKRLGRVRTADANASRTIDLDILLHGSTVDYGKGIAIPDPDIRTRVFVALPLLELNPELVLPDTREALRDLPILNKKESLTHMPQIREAVLTRIGP